MVQVTEIKIFSVECNLMAAEGPWWFHLLKGDIYPNS